MTTPKFLDIVTNNNSTITVNTNNIATFERIGNGVKIVLNITDSDGRFIEYTSLIQMTETMNPLFKQD